MTEFTLTNPSIGEYKVQGSSFHAVSEMVSSANHIKSQLLKLKKQFPDASHISYAFRIKKDKSLDEFASDAGEPNGSAGIPILNVLKRNQIVNTVIFVIRYFGGTKLGIPGLIHAYSTSAEEAIKNARLRPWIEKQQLSITYPYQLEGVMRLIFLKKYQVEVIHENFGEKIDIQLDIDVTAVDEFIDSIRELSAGSTQIIIKK